jgi:DNA polymerase V
MKIKFFETTLPAGFPSQAEDYVEEQLDLNELMIEHPTATFFIRVEGDSMEPKIQSGSLLVIDRSLTPKNHDVVVALLRGEFTVKRLESEGDKIRLVADNSKYPPIKVSPESDFQVWGVVTYVISRTR